MSSEFKTLSKKDTWMHPNTKSMLNYIRYWNENSSQVSSEFKEVILASFDNAVAAHHAACIEAKEVLFESYEKAKAAYGEDECNWEIADAMAREVYENSLKKADEAFNNTRCDFGYSCCVWRMN